MPDGVWIGASDRRPNFLYADSKERAALVTPRLQDCLMRIVKQIPGEMRKLPNHFFDHVRMAMSRDKNAHARTSEQRGYEPPSRSGIPRSPHDSRMGTHAEKLIEY